jgi:hypothetical protein
VGVFVGLLTGGKLPDPKVRPVKLAELVLPPVALICNHKETLACLLGMVPSVSNPASVWAGRFVYYQRPTKPKILPEYLVPVCILDLHLPPSLRDFSSSQLSDVCEHVASWPELDLLARVVGPVPELVPQQMTSLGSRPVPQRRGYTLLTPILQCLLQTRPVVTTAPNHPVGDYRTPECTVSSQRSFMRSGHLFESEMP